MPQSKKGLCGKGGFHGMTFMLTSIVLSIIVLPGITFLVVCLVGFHRAEMRRRPIRVQIERLQTENIADDSQLPRPAAGYRKTA